MLYCIVLVLETLKIQFAGQGPRISHWIRETCDANIKVEERSFLVRVQKVLSKVRFFFFFFLLL